MSQGLGDKPFCAGNHFTLADMAVGCALGYLDFRFAAHRLAQRVPQPGSACTTSSRARQSFIDTRAARGLSAQLVAG